MHLNSPRFSLAADLPGLPAQENARATRAVENRIQDLEAAKRSALQARGFDAGSSSLGLALGSLDQAKEVRK